MSVPTSHSEETFHKLALAFNTAKVWAEELAQAAQELTAQILITDNAVGAKMAAVAAFNNASSGGSDTGITEAENQVNRCEAELTTSMVNEWRLRKRFRRLISSFYEKGVDLYSDESRNASFERDGNYPNSVNWAEDVVGSRQVLFGSSPPELDIDQIALNKAKQFARQISLGRIELHRSLEHYKAAVNHMEVLLAGFYPKPQRAPASARYGSPLKQQSAELFFE